MSIFHIMRIGAKVSCLSRDRATRRSGEPVRAAFSRCVRNLGQLQQCRRRC